MKWKERGMVSMINKDYFKYLIKQNICVAILLYGGKNEGRKSY